jgi:hypothetical protein
MLCVHMNRVCVSMNVKSVYVRERKSECVCVSVNAKGMSVSQSVHVCVYLYK